MTLCLCLFVFFFVCMCVYLDYVYVYVCVYVPQPGKLTLTFKKAFVGSHLIDEHKHITKIIRLALTWNTSWRTCQLLSFSAVQNSKKLSTKNYKNCRLTILWNTLLWNQASAILRTAVTEKTVIVQCKCNAAYFSSNRCQQDKWQDKYNKMLSIV